MSFSRWFFLGRRRRRAHGSFVVALRGWVFAGVLAVAAALAPCAHAQSGDAASYFFTTLAGDAGRSGAEDGIGSAARFHWPGDVAVDPAGNAIVSDRRNNTLRKITPAGVVTTFAGLAGVQWHADGPIGAALFNHPAGLAFDAGGNLFVADEGNRAIRKISSDGMVTTIAGRPGVRGYADGPGREAMFDEPTDVAVDARGNVFVVDSTNEMIRKIAPDGMVSTFAGMVRDTWEGGSRDGTGSAAQFNIPLGIAVDGGGTLFVADTYNHTIRKVTSAGVVTTLAGLPGVPGYADGEGSAARFNYPSKLTVDRGGNLVVSDLLNSVLRKVTPAGVVTTIRARALHAGSPAPTGTGFDLPKGVAVDRAGNIIVVEARTHSVRRGVPAPVFLAQPASRTVRAGETATFSAGEESALPVAYQWLRNGAPIAGATSGTLTVANVQPGDAGLYSVAATNAAGTSQSEPAVLGLISSVKVVGAGAEIGADVAHANGNVYDQVLLTGGAATITADAGQVTRLSYVDLNDDIVQVEFGGAGALTLVLKAPTGPAAPANYVQPGVSYMKGHATIVVAGATATTHVAVHSVGRSTTTNQALFKVGTAYDGVADLARVAILSADGKCGGVRTANGNYFDTAGLTGLHAPGVAFAGPVYLGDISAFDDAAPALETGSVADARIAGGDLLQVNGRPVAVSGLTRLMFVAGSTSHGGALPARNNRAVLQQGGVDVTTRIAVNP